MSSPIVKSNSIICDAEKYQSPQHDLVSNDEGSINTIRSNSEHKDAVQKPFDSTPKPIFLNAEKSVLDSDRKY